MRKPIILGSDISIPNVDGYGLTCKLQIESEGYIPDLYVWFSDKDIRILRLEEMELYDDRTFVKGVMDFLRTQGYRGADFGRAELGLQGVGFIVLEPNQEFTQWAKNKYGWIDLDERTTNA